MSHGEKCGQSVMESCLLLVIEDMTVPAEEFESSVQTQSAFGPYHMFVAYVKSRHYTNGVNSWVCVIPVCF